MDLMDSTPLPFNKNFTVSTWEGKVKWENKQDLEDYHIRLEKNKGGFLLSGKLGNLHILDEDDEDFHFKNSDELLDFLKKYNLMQFIYAQTKMNKIYYRDDDNLICSKTYPGYEFFGKISPYLAFFKYGYYHIAYLKELKDNKDVIVSWNIEPFCNIQEEDKEKFKIYNKELSGPIDKLNVPIEVGYEILNSCIEMGFDNSVPLSNWIIKKCCYFIDNIKMGSEKYIESGKPYRTTEGKVYQNKSELSLHKGMWYYDVGLQVAPEGCEKNLPIIENV